MMREDLGQLRQAKGYSMDMMAGFLGKTLEEYAELEFGLKQPDGDDLAVLEKLFGQISQIMAI